MSPREELSQPPDYTSGADGWRVLASDSRVNKSWEALMEQAPENTRKCYEHLRMQPLQRIRGRVFYVPRPEDRTVLVYYAGEHPPKGRVPFPPEPS